MVDFRLSATTSGGSWATALECAKCDDERRAKDEDEKHHGQDAAGDKHAVINGERVQGFPAAATGEGGCALTRYDERCGREQSQSEEI